VGTQTAYRMRSSNSNLNKFYGNEVSYSVKDKNGKWKQMSTQSEGRSDASGIIRQRYNPVDIDRLEAGKKAGEMMNAYGDKATKFSILTGNPILGVGGAIVSGGGNALQIYSDFQMGKYESAGRGTGVVLGEDILNRAGDAIIDAKVKNPLINRGSKLILQETLRQGSNKITDQGNKKK